MGNFTDWYNRFKLSDTYKKLEAHPVAYFCMEYALPKNLPIYAGGLGVLAGDYVIEAYQQNFPMVAIGLFYSRKCHIHTHEDTYVTNDPIHLGLKPVVDKFGNRIKVYVPIQGRRIAIQAWLYDEGTVPIYLLDTNLVDNNEEDFKITDTLYITDHDLRIKQEMVLGIGGARLLEALSIQPSVFHMNEGHSALLSYEISKNIMHKEGIDFESAFLKAKNGIAFTNHTLVVGGHDIFEKEFVGNLLASYAEEIDIPLDSLLNKGIKPEENEFGTTELALNSASKVNAVSNLHAEMAKKTWPDFEMKPITNGINILRWEKVKTTEKLLSEHLENKKRLLDRVRRETGYKWHENDLLAGWARRITSYKRPIAFLDDLEQVKKIILNKERPVRLIFAGYPHYHDQEGHWLLNQIRQLANSDLKGHMIFLEGYSTELSQLMLSGCDVWLNTPVVGLEACGTSGMKAALNGTLPCSTVDGWIPEVDINKIGFSLDSESISSNFRETLSEYLVPIFYSKFYLENEEWHNKMLASRQTIINNFGTDRMLKDYIEQIYEPILHSSPLM